MMLGERQIIVDCDVLQADGGTRTAAITGGWVALRLAGAKLVKARECVENPIVEHIAAVSCGVHEGQVVLDLDYAEDSGAGTDANFVITGSGGLVELQCSAEGAVVSEVARRHGLSPQQLFGLRARLRDAVKGSARSSDATPAFVPAILENEPPLPALAGSICKNTDKSRELVLGLALSAIAEPVPRSVSDGGL